MRTDAAASSVVIGVRLSPGIRLAPPLLLMLWPALIAAQVPGLHSTDPCSLPQAARNLFVSRQQPAGIEYLPAGLACRRSATEWTLLGHLQTLPTPDALTELVGRDPHYKWTVRDGVYVVRPVESWNDASHFLHKRVPSFEAEQNNLGGVLNAVATALAGFRVSGLETPRSGPPSPELLRRFSVHVRDGSMLDVLNTAVREHGALLWEVTYCKPQSGYEFATLSLRTFDQRGESVHTGWVDDTGRWREGCRSR